MKTITLADLNQTDFDTAAATVTAGIKAYNAKLDTRDGTVLRDLLVNPEAAVEGVVMGQIAEARKVSSLKLLQAAQEAGETIDQADVNAIMANFNITPPAGTCATGLVKIVVSDGSVAYSVPAGTVFSTTDGVEFASNSQVVAMLASVSNPSVKATTELYKGTSGYFFLVGVTASASGESGNISSGTSLTPASQVPSFVMAEAYKDFDGGSDTQSLSAAIKSIPSGLSIRGFVNRNAVEGMLRDRFDSGDYPIVAVSTVGYGNEAQRRDRHNVFGVSVGGRVDVYVRNFTDAVTVTKTLTGTRIGSTAGYTIDVPVGTFPGACWVKSVSDPYTSGDSEDVLNSLSFGAVRTANVSDTWHDFDDTDAVKEAFNTVWQGFTITLDDVPADSSSGTDEWSSTRPFKVTMYCMPNASDIQEYVDQSDIRSVSTDVVARCPIVCSVSVNAIVKYDPSNPIDADTARTRIRSYINGLGFVGSLTRSEIVQILKNLGAVSVDMQNQDMLYGELHDASGEKHVLSGDALDVSSISDGSVMLTKDTVVFCAEEGNIQIKLTPNT